MAECQHRWNLVETGYERQWITEFDKESKTLKATSSGQEDFGESGAGDEHLRCSACLATKDIPEGWEIEYE